VYSRRTVEEVEAIASKGEGREERRHKRRSPPPPLTGLGRRRRRRRADEGAGEGDGGSGAGARRGGEGKGANAARAKGKTTWDRWCWYFSSRLARLRISRVATKLNNRDTAGSRVSRGEYQRETASRSVYVRVRARVRTWPTPKCWCHDRPLVGIAGPIAGRTEAEATRCYYDIDATTPRTPRGSSRRKISGRWTDSWARPFSVASADTCAPLRTPLDIAPGFFLRQVDKRRKNRPFFGKLRDLYTPDFTCHMNSHVACVCARELVF